MPVDERYRRQVTLLVRTLPFVAEETCFALKGGTAINLFVRDLPRLSVDIDLTCLPVASREESLADIDAGLLRIAGRIEASIAPNVERLPAVQWRLENLARLDGRRRSELVADLEAALAQSASGLPATPSGDAER